MARQIGYHDPLLERWRLLTIYECRDWDDSVVRQRTRWGARGAGSLQASRSSANQPS